MDRTIDRRRALQLLLGGAGLVALVGCGDDDGGGASATTTGQQGSGATSAAAAGAIPEETAGPYPGDGSNGPDVLSQDGVVRQDITSSFGGADGVAEGIPLRLDLTVVDAASGAARPGAAVYVWHCDRDARYSLYSDGATGENYLRGVQEAGGDGRLAFDSIFPGAYTGRWPHVHFEVYANVDDATGGGSPIATSQLALPEDTCAAVYAEAGYDQSVPNLAQTSLQTDMVFSDGVDQQLPEISGDVSGGLTAALTIPV
jgi:protocatechuate 3,4-dioxygenase beta subunit